MFKTPITFDSFIRGIIALAIAVGAGLLLDRLSSVLLPFFIAWLLAYMIYPLVRFLQVKCRLRNRTLSIVVAVVLVAAALTGLTLAVVPPMVSEFSKLGGLFHEVTDRYLGDTELGPYLLGIVEEYTAEYQSQLLQLVQEKSFVDAAQGLLGYLWTAVSQTVNFAIGLVGSLIVLLYMFFILQDYEAISGGWIGLIPQGSRQFVQQLVDDVESGMNAYFRGQGLVAFCVGVLFSIGFLIVGMPMAIGLGLFMGFLNLVPYLQTLGFVPMVLLALMRSADTGESFWAIFGLGVLVVGVVQLIQDMVLVPRIMGSAMGLKPALILLSLSIWGSLLGFIGLIIALPLTTLLISYYRRFVIGHAEEAELPAAGTEE
ncbi:MAG: AI-2E family transporter [Bacteroidaceae bacterium]|nr:AI-2E family transporter [Bacteroidaceae bacterium]